MGWIVTHKPPNQSWLEFFRQEYDSERQTADGKTRRVHVLDCAVLHFNTAYLALQTQDEGQPPEVQAVICDLIYYRDRYYNVGYQARTEKEAYYYQCPERILDQLTPTDSEAANLWRAKCRAYHQARRATAQLKPGQIIRFEQPLLFRDGQRFDTFKVLDPKDYLFSPYIHSKVPYKIRRATLLQVPYTVLPEPESEPNSSPPESIPTHT